MNRSIGFVGTMLVLLGGYGTGVGGDLWLFWVVLAWIGTATISWVIP